MVDTNVRQFKVTIDRQTLSGDADFRRHVINHETGHTLGFGDPTPSVRISKAAETCRMFLDRNLDGVQDIPVVVVSIMHNTGWCGENAIGEDFSIGDVAYPTDYDRLIAELIVTNSPLVSGD